MTQQKQNHTEQPETAASSPAPSVNRNTKPQADGAPPAASPGNAAEKAGPAEVGGRRGPEPTRYGDWENKGKCVDF